MSNIAIRFENISKQYRLGLVSTKTLSHDVNRWWQTSVLGKEDPYLKIGEVNNQKTKGASDYVWALRNISFDVEQGDVIGIIGKNGAGKSTLLKILSRITTPTTGYIKTKGRLASLLEVGTGFHQEMTGRENIYMNGAILGMTKHEIDRKLDAIVEFSGVERYLDTPVKRYSSGMRVRLGFAVAAHLDPDILVVDEVLAVGDAEFQKKAIGKMQDVAQGEGRTVLFVSHNMNSISRLCKNGIVLQNGQIIFKGVIEEAIDNYISNYLIDENANVFYIPDIDAQKDKDIILHKADFIDNNKNRIDNVLDVRTSFNLRLQIEFKKDIKSPKITFHFKNSRDEFVWFNDMADVTENIPHSRGMYEFVIPIKQPLLKPDTYMLSVGIVNMDNNQTNHFPNILKIELIDYKGVRGTRAGYLYTETEWNVQTISQRND